MKEFSRFLTAKQVEQEVDLDPNKKYTQFELLVLAAKVFRADFMKRKLQRQQQQLSDPSPMITGEKGNQCFSGQNSVDNACKKEDISIPRKARTKKAVLDLSKLDKKMATTSQRVISNKSEYPEGMCKEEVLRRERLLKRPMDFDDENVMQKRVKRDCERVARLEDSDSGSDEEYCQVKKTQKTSPRRRILREEVLNRERVLKRPREIEEENVMQKRVKRDYKVVVRFEDSEYDSKKEFQEMKKTQKRSSRKTPDYSKKKKEKKKNNKGCFGMHKIEILNPPQELPEKFMSRIKAMGGKNKKLVITKRLTASDCTDGEGRLSMPFSKIKEFLFENEKIYLQQRNESNGKNGKKVVLIQPNLEEIDINLKQWDMPKPNGVSNSKMYVLVKPWNDVVRENKLREGEEIQVWSFRVGEEDELRLAIVRLSDYYGEGTSNVGPLMYGEGTSNVGQLSNSEGPSNVGQLIPYGEGTSNVGQLMNGEGPSNVGQLSNSEEPADVCQQSMRIESECTGTSANSKEQADVGQLIQNVEVVANVGQLMESEELANVDQSMTE